MNGPAIVMYTTSWCPYCERARRLLAGKGASFDEVDVESAPEKRAEITPAGYKEFGRTLIIEPNHPARGREVVWSHPAFANKCIYTRNDKEILCVPLAYPTAQ